MFRTLFIAAYLICVGLFVYGLTKLPEHNSNRSQKSEEEITAEYNQLVLSSAAFKIMIGGISGLTFLIIVHLIYRLCYPDIAIEPLIVRPRHLPVPQPVLQPVPQPVLQPVPQPVPDSVIMELKPSIKKSLGPHITHLPLHGKLTRF